MTSVSAQSFEDIKVEAFKICQDFLGQPWKGLSFSEFGFSEVSGGLSNSLYCCALPENTIVKNPQTPKQVLLRIYGPLQDETNIIVTEAATFTLLAERKLGPKLFGIFSNGRLEEFIPSRTCKSKDYRLIYPDIARELAKIHALEVPVRKVPDFWQKYFKKWLNEIEDETLQKYNKTFESGDIYREEYEWLTEEMKKTDSPVVYCHNDLQGGNILLRQDSSSDGDHKLMLIDFEFGAYNYRGFDLANQFCEWSFDYNTGEYPHFEVNFDQFPSEQEQTSYIRAYLDQLVLEGAFQPTDVESEIKTILKEIDVFCMAAHLLWSLWSHKMTFLSVMDFAHKEHGKVRTQAYFAIKEKYLKREICNGGSELIVPDQ